MRRGPLACMTAVSFKASPRSPANAMPCKSSAGYRASGDAWLRVRWQSPDGKWILENEDVLLYADGPRGEWHEIFGAVQVPPGVGRLVGAALGGGQTTTNDMAWFSAARVFKLEIEIFAGSESRFTTNRLKLCCRRVSDVALSQIGGGK